jgi:phage terminase small subunit
MGELTDKQKAFVYEYMKSKNATRAAVAAGYSEKTAYSIGSELLKKPEVAEFLAQQEAELKRDLRERFAEEAEMAFETVVKIAQGISPPGVKKPSARTVLDAAKDLLDRAGYKPTDKIDAHVENDGQLNVVFNIPRPKKEGE